MKSIKKLSLKLLMGQALQLKTEEEKRLNTSLLIKQI